MKKTHRLTRRDFLKYTAAGSAWTLAALAGGNRLFSQNQPAGTAQPVSNHEPDLEILMRSVYREASILPGRATAVWHYQGELIRGEEQALEALPGSYLGPIIRVRRGQRLRVRFENRIEQESIIHWHGLHLPEDMDGQPRYAIAPGDTYVYDFTVRDRPGTYWYHPHPHGRTGPQVYYGLAGLLLVSDGHKTGLPEGAQDIPLVLQDRTFDGQNRLVYLGGGMMDRMTGFLGDRILVNGRPDYTLRVNPRAYRLRLLNGSNSRIYKLAWSDSTPLTVIGTDGGLLEEPAKRPYAMLGPGERLELWVDFSGYDPDSRLRLVSLSYTHGADGGLHEGMRGMGRGMGTGMMGDVSLLPQGSSFPVMDFIVSGAEKYPGTLPQRLSTLERQSIDEAVNRRSPRRFDFAMQGMVPTINGRTFEMNGVAEDEVVQLNTTEIWELVNNSGGMSGMHGMQMPHPVHVHGLQFRVLERDVHRSYAEDWKTIRDGFVDEGLKDTVLLLPGTRIRIVLSFRDYGGMYLIHCHNLEHEDLGMMRNYLVRP